MSKYTIIGKGGLHDIIIDILDIEDYLGFYDDKESLNFILGILVK